MVGGSSRVANAPRKEKASVKAVTPLRFAAPGESVPQSSASSSRRSSGGPKISIRMSDHGPDVLRSVSPMKVSSDIEDKRKGLSDYRVARSLLKSVILPTDIQTFEEVGGAFHIQDSYDSLFWLIHHVDHFVEIIREAKEESKSLKERVKQLEFELTKAEAWVLGEREAEKAQAEAVRVEAVEAFDASKEFHNIKMDFASLSYLQGDIDLKEKVWRIFSDLNLDLSESDDEKAEEAEGREIQMKDVFSPARDDLAAEDAALVPPPAVIILPNQVEVGESGALDEA
ncbi:hypothetical protein COCNU_16G007880 [Cocos nucifera]|uniref:Uncharacterized protein n=1 Tax=Cocos nucifera TaxID=13894 RepID=A0A8K0IZ74_COCNU|nr:hypothetical protein COCNU_16G007880 [Cocos nucifera]